MNRKTQFHLLLVGLALSITVTTLFINTTVGATQALSVRNQHTSPHCVIPLPPFPGDLRYFCGPIMPGVVKVYPIFWTGGQSLSKSYQTLILRYFRDLGSTQGGKAFYHILSQYTDSAGHSPQGEMLAGSWVDTTTPYPRCAVPPCNLDGGQILVEVQRAMQANSSWPQQGSYTNLFAVYTLGGVWLDGVRCALHYFTPYDQKHPPIIYLHIAEPRVTNCIVPQSPNGDRDADSAINWTTHAQFEAATDLDAGKGWYVPIIRNGEISDMCENSYQALDFDHGKANQDWGGDYYIIQRTWNNSTGECTTGHT